MKETNNMNTRDPKTGRFTKKAVAVKTPAKKTTKKVAEAKKTTTK